MKRLLPILIALLLASGLAAGAAEAKIVKLTGQTTQGFPVVAWVKNGRLVLVRLKWTARCHRTHDVLGPTNTYWRDTPDGPIEQTGNTFTDSGTLRYRLPRKQHGVVHEKLKGTFSTTKVSGVQTISESIFNRRGKKLDVCSSKVRFSASG
jgi:hypothetical protein